jgi:hypothetical protein
MSTHTPGPWKVFRVEDGANKGKIIGIGDADAGGVTDPFGGLWRSGKELEANAELIAAAPDLLAPAQDAIAILDVAIDLWNSSYPDEEDEVFSDLQARFRAAIAKATGAA